MLKKYHLLYIVLLVIAGWACGGVCPAAAQQIEHVDISIRQRYFDSLSREYSYGTSPAGRAKAASLLVEYHTYYSDTAEEAGRIGRTGLRLAHSGGVDHKVLVDVHLALAHFYFRQEAVNQYLSHFDSVLYLSRKYKYELGLYHYYFWRGRFFGQVGLRDSSHRCFSLAAAHAGSAGDKLHHASALNALGNNFAERGQKKEAISFLRSALAIWERYMNEQSAGVRSDLGNVYFDLGNYDSAMCLYRQALKVAQSPKGRSVLGMAFSLNNIGLVQMAQGRHDSAIVYFEKALSFYALDGSDFGYANTTYNLGEAYYHGKDYERARQMASRCLKLSRQKKFNDLILQSYNLFASIHAALGQYAEAYRYQKAASHFTDSAKGMAMAEAKAAARAQISSFQQAAEYNVLKAQKERQDIALQNSRLMAVAGSTILALSVFVGVLLYRSNRRRKHALEMMHVQNEVIRRKNEEQAHLNAEVMHQKQRLEELVLFKDKLFTIISHDFRSPLVGLHGFLMLVEDEEMPLETLKIFSRALAERLAVTSDLVDNMLGWAQGQLNGFVSQKKQINIWMAAESILQLYRAAAEAKGLILTNAIHPSKTIFADSGMVEHLLRNLITNAIKFSSAGDAITVSCERTEEGWVVSVRDTGRGMSREVLAKLFKGQRYSLSGTANEKGSGLGLSLCKEFVERNGGRIWAESEEGGGSTFQFLIPFATADEKEIVRARTENVTDATPVC